MVSSEEIPVVDLERLYHHRFSDPERKQKDQIWKILCKDYFQRFIDKNNDTVLDVGSGLGEFSRHIQAKRKIAVDLNPNSQRLIPKDVEFYLTSAETMSSIEDNSVDVAFSSHFLEHLPTKASVDRVLSEIFRVLKPGGIYVALQPNIRLCKWRYWDYHDHQVAMSDRSGEEAFVGNGYKVKKIIRRFLPFTTKSWIPNHPLLVRLYLAFPPIWLIMGKTFLIVGQKP